MAQEPLHDLSSYFLLEIFYQNKDEEELVVGGPYLEFKHAAQIMADLGSNVATIWDIDPATVKRLSIIEQITTNGHKPETIRVCEEIIINDRTS